MPPSDALLIVAAVCFAAMLAASFLIAPRNRLDGRGGRPLPIPGLRNAPVLHLELARNESDLKELLMAGDVQRNVADARAGNRLDTFLFIPAYAVFLFAIGLLLGGVGSALSGAALLLAVAAVPAAAVCDWLENAGIGRALDHIASAGAPAAGDARAISTPSIVKWALLALILIMYGLAALTGSAGWAVRAGGLLLLVSGVWVLSWLAPYVRRRMRGAQVTGAVR